MKASIFSSLVLSLSLPACTLSLPGDDAGTSSDAGEEPVTTQTVGDQCTAIFTELCGQALSRCGLATFTLDQCINADLPTCCTGSQCNDISQSSAADVMACQQAIDAEDCNSIVNSTPPSACVGVPAKP